MKQPLLVIAGATACGKTDLSIKIAESIGGEIISADSMQVYKYMDIGTAKPTTEEMRGIKHYLIDELYPDEEYSVAVFQSRAKAYIEEIAASGKVPIVCGGTGFYINALIYGNDFTEAENDRKYREELYRIAEEKGAAYLHNMLKQADASAAELIHPNNVKRVARALEFYKQTGERISVHNEREKAREPLYAVNMLILYMDRKTLYERINSRVDKMLERGLVGEVQHLLDLGYNNSMVSMQGLGYKEIVRYLEGGATLEEAADDIKKGTRRFAKRQDTWFKNQDRGLGKWINMADMNISELIKRF